MMRSSSSWLSNTTRPLTASSTTVWPSWGFLKRITGVTPGIGFGAVAAAAVVAGFLLAGHLLGAHGLQLLLAAIAVVGMTFRQQLLGHLAVTVEALGLVEGALVGLEIQPGHAVQDRLHRLLGGALPVRILDAQDELPP